MRLDLSGCDEKMIRSLKSCNTVAILGDRKKFIEEAQRQSLLASKMDNKENAPWDEEADDSGWI